ncbi:MAG: hypothetical protein LBD82_06695, partial [Deltaproteobacteria bacterium]|nr:hypothetical protein [Deltaproteobacteria bacterium]
ITNFIIKLKYAPERAVFHFFQTKKARKKIKFSGKRRQGGEAGWVLNRNRALGGSALKISIFYG